MASNSIVSVIDKTREILRQTSDDSVFSDELLYSVLLDKRNLLINRELNKHKHRSSFIYKTICMPLELSSDIPCECIPACFNTCSSLKSCYKLPKPVNTISDDVIKVLSIDGSKEYTYKEVRVGKYNKYTRLGNIKPYYTIYNEYIYIIGHHSKRLPAIMVRMVPEDPVSTDGIDLCDKEGNKLGETCFDPTVDTFNIDGHLVSPLIEMTLQQLVPSLQYPEDILNDSISTQDQVKV